RRNDRPPAHAQEMGDQGLYICHGLFFEGRRRERMACLVRSAGHVLEALLDDSQALSHFLHMDDCTVVTIAVVRCRYIEVEMLIAGIRSFLSEVPFEAAGPKVWTGPSPLDRLIQGKKPHAFSPGLNDAVLH